MKRFFLLSLVAAFVSLMSVSAQDNTYSMIIKLANGTTLTIGPNEVDSISFNDGEITVAGSTINDLVAKITKAQIESQMRIDSLTNVVDRNAYEFMDMIAKIQSCQCDMSNFLKKDEIAAVLNQYATMEDSRIDSLANVLMMHYATMEDIMKMVADIPIPDLSNYPTREQMADMLSKYATKEELQYEQDIRKKDVSEISYRVDELYARVSKDTNELQEMVAALKYYVDNLQKEIDELKGN